MRFFKEDGMKEMAVFLQTVKGFADHKVAEDKAESVEESKKDSYTTVTQKGNCWDAFVCSVGRGRYIWSDGTCGDKNIINWRR